jgi:hypothetical protein
MPGKQQKHKEASEVETKVYEQRISQHTDLVLKKCSDDN